MKIIVISNNKTIENEDKIITKLFEAGLDNFHLRKPRMSTKGLATFLEKIPEHFHNRIVIHSHHNLAAKFKLKGIHITKSHLKNLRRTKWKLWILSFRRPLKNLTLSTSISQLPDIYKPDEFGYNYIFLNPIFNPLTGKLQNGFYEQGLKAANEKSGKQLIARGGVNISSIEIIQHLGFHGLALNSSIWSNEDPVNYFLKITDECQRLGIKINP